MSIDYDFSDGFKKIIYKLNKKDPHKAQAIKNKIEQIINSNEITIDYYKNLRAPLNEYKRVHINTHFVLIFKYDKLLKKIIFYDFDHHDNIYLKRK